MSLSDTMEELRRALAAEHGILVKPDDELLLAMSAVLKIARVMFDEAQAAQLELAATAQATEEIQRERWLQELSAAVEAHRERICREARKEINALAISRAETLVRAINDVGARHVVLMRRLAWAVLASACVGAAGVTAVHWWMR